jgi:hypothetical protein
MTDEQAVRLPALRTADGGTIEQTYRPPSTTTPVDPPPVDPPPSTGRPPLAAWKFGWKPLIPLADWPADVFAAVDVVHAAMAQSAGKGSGRLTTPPNLSRGEVARLVEAGKAVHVGIGGSKDGGIAVTNPGQVAEARASLLAMRRDYGYTGATVDLEPSGSNWTHGPMVELCRALAADGFTVEICSSLYKPWTERWGAVVRELGPALTRWSVMAYDYPEAGDARHRATTLGKVGMMLGYTTAEKIAVAFMPRPKPDYLNASPVPVLLDAAAAVRAAHPQVGFAVWEDRIDAAQGWATLRGLSRLLAA